MQFDEFLKFTLYKRENFNITVNSIFIVLVILLVTLIGLAVLKRGFKRFISKNVNERRSYWSVYLNKIQIPFPQRDVHIKKSTD